MKSRAKDISVRLDLLRIVVSLLVLISPEVDFGFKLSSVQPPSVSAPWGFGWVHEYIGPQALLGNISLILVYGGAALGLLGIFARVGLAAVSIGLFYLIGWLQMRGATVHCHHLLWFSVALACSPCSDTLKLGRRPIIYCGDRYRGALTVIYAIIAMIFFFPGWYKMTLGGWAWFSGETLYNTMLWKSAQYWDQPIELSFAESSAYAPLSWVAVLFEVSAPLVLLGFRQTALFLILALGFHVGTSLMFNIDFTNLWPCYVVLVPWERWVSVIDQSPRHVTTHQRTSKVIKHTAPKYVAISLCIGVALAGVSREIKGWPFACYPTFHQEISHRMPLMSVVVRDVRGKARRIHHQRYMRPTNSSWSTNWRLAGLYGKANHDELRRFAERVIKPLLSDTDERALFFLSWIDLKTEEVRDRRLLFEWPLSHPLKSQ